MGLSTALAISGLPLTAEVRVQLQANSRGICGVQSGSGVEFFPCQNHSTDVTCPFIHQSPTLNNLNNCQLR